MNNKTYFIISPRSEPSTVLLPEASALVPAGFPSPADDYTDRSLDLNEYLIRNQAASFFIRVAGESMHGAGILPGDILLVDRSVNPVHNKIVVAVLDNEMVVKRLRFKEGQAFLVSENPGFPCIEITHAMEACIWGVVIAVIRKLA